MRALTTVLTAAPLRQVSGEVAAQMAAMPLPEEIAPALAALVP